MLPSAIPEGGVMLSGTRYLLRRRLGEGSFGAAYLAEDTTLGRPVVIKILKDTSDAEASLRFLREARILARIRHHGVVEIHDVGEEAQGAPFFVMEFVEGEVLTAHLHARGAISAAEACTLIAHVCDALAAAHAHGIVHRDVKPDNLLVTKAGLVKVIDFGIAKRLATDPSSPTASVTALGTMLGTPRYLAPEQARGQPVGPGTDLYAVGCVLYEVLTGRPPFDGPLQEVVRQHVQTPAPALSAATNLRFPPPLEALVARLLAKDPRARGDRADAVAAELRAISTDGATTKIVIATLPYARTEPSFAPPRLAPTGSAPTNPTRAPLVIASAAVLVVLVAVAIVVVLVTRTSETGAVNETSAAKPGAKTSAARDVIDADEVRRNLEAVAGWDLATDAPYTYSTYSARIIQLHKGGKHATISIYAFDDPGRAPIAARDAREKLPDSMFLVRKRSFAIVTVEPTDTKSTKLLAEAAFAGQ